MTAPEQTQAIRILIADDHPIVCEGLAALINRRPDMLVVAEAHSGQEAIELFRQHKPDLILLDLRMPGVNGIEACRAIHAEDPTTRLIILTTYDDDEALSQARQAGAATYLVKDAPRQELLACIRAVYRGEASFPEKIPSPLAERKSEVALTGREREVLELLGEGKSNKEISAALTIAEGTVKLHLSNIFGKLGANSRVEALTLALTRGILRLERQ
jgi:two-component system, NarL family, response regulator